MSAGGRAVTPSPRGAPGLAWSLGLLALGLAACLIIPFQVAFGHRVRLAGSLAVYLIDAVFVADLWRRRRAPTAAGDAAPPSPGIRPARPGLFAFDAFATAPLDLLLLPWRAWAPGGVSIMLWVRLLRLLRVRRFLEVFRIWARQSWSNAGAVRLGRLAVVAALFLHLVACAWFVIPFAEGFPEASWVVREGVAASGAWVQYVRALYWVIVTTTTVGYGDITPVRTVEYLFTMALMIGGASFYAFVIGNIAALLNRLDTVKSSFWGRVETVTQYLRRRGVPAGLNEQVHGYYEYLWSQYRGARDQAVLADLPPSLRLELLQHLTKELTARVPLFRHCPEPLRNALLLALEPQVIVPGGVVVRRGEVGDGMYFIGRGAVEILGEEGRAHGTLREGDYFGDLSLLLGEPRTASVRALTYCDMFFLAREEFARLRSAYPELRESLKRLSTERSEKLSALVLDGVVL